MIKQIFGKLPRKHSKSSHNDINGEGEVNAPSSYLDPNSTNSSKPSNLANGTLTLNASLTGSVSAAGMHEALLSFKDVPSSEKSNLFIRKLNMCCIVFDFSDSSKNLKEKEIKRQNLLELVDYISSVSTKFNDMEMQEVRNMVAANLFRTFPSANHSNEISEMYDLEEAESAFEPSWPHLQAVYEVLLRFVVSPQTDAKLAKKHINQAFVLSLLDLFDSEDQRERDYLKTVLHRVYGKFMVQRPFIRKAINNIFYRFTYETEKHSGIAELLEILGSIINGFALPLKEEHKLFLVRTLIPLHKPKCAAAYHQQLSYSIVQFVEKDSKLADTIIRGLLKYWPLTNSSKEVMFLGELEEVLEATQATEFQRCAVPLFRQIGRCLNSFHFQVAERALLLWNNDHIRDLIIQNRKLILPIIFPALERNTDHWNQTVRNLTLNVEKFFSDTDKKLLDECLVKHREDKANQNEIRTKRESTWKQLDDLAASRTRGINEAVSVPRFISSIPLQSFPSPAEVAKEEKLLVK